MIIPANRISSEVENKIIDSYLKTNKTTEEIAEIFFVSKTTISNVIKRNNIKKRHTYWTPNEDLILIQKYPIFGPKKCAEILNKKEDSVLNRAFKLNLKVEVKHKSIRPNKESQIKILIPWEDFDNARCEDLIPFECPGCCETKFRDKATIYINIKNGQEHIFCSRECMDIINKAKFYAGLLPTYGNFKKSIPCERLKSQLKDRGIPFQEEVHVLRHMGRRYRADILFEEWGTIVEINGSQHYGLNGDLSPYYRERHQMLVDAGWRVIEVPCNDVFTVGFLDNLLKTIYDKSAPLNHDLEYKKFIPKLNFCECGVEMDRESKKCLKCWFESKHRTCPLTREEFHWYLWNNRLIDIQKFCRTDHFTVKKWIKEFKFTETPKSGYRLKLYRATIIDYQI